METGESPKDGAPKTAGAIEIGTKGKGGVRFLVGKTRLNHRQLLMIVQPRRAQGITVRPLGKKVNPKMRRFVPTQRC
jgi:hypothetical protein